MSAPEDRYLVVVNHEEQYSVWFADRDIPMGWRPVGEAGTKQECLAHIESVWTDLTPLSVRRSLSEPAAEVLPR
jgi:MbtH protein